MKVITVKSIWLPLVYLYSDPAMQGMEKTLKLALACK